MLVLVLILSYGGCKDKRRKSKEGKRKKLPKEDRLLPSFVPSFLPLCPFAPLISVLSSFLFPVLVPFSRKEAEGGRRCQWKAAKRDRTLQDTHSIHVLVSICGGVHQQASIHLMVLRSSGLDSHVTCTWPPQELDACATRPRDSNPPAPAT